MIEHLRLEATIAGYQAAAARQAATEHADDAVAALLGAQREAIALVENATRAWDMALYARQRRP